MKTYSLEEYLLEKPLEITREHLLENLKAGSGGERDLNFLNFLLDSRLLSLDEVVMKRTTIGISEEYFQERYRKIKFESDRHFVCRAIILEELARLGINADSGVNVGNMSILRENSCYDIATHDLQAILDIGLTPARNFFRGLTDLRVKSFLVTAFFDDYMDDIAFSRFKRKDDQAFLDAVRDYEEGFKPYKANGNAFQETFHSFGDNEYQG